MKTPKHPGVFHPGHKPLGIEPHTSAPEELLPERLQAILSNPEHMAGTVTIPAAFLVELLKQNRIPDAMLPDFVSFFYDALCSRSNPYTYEDYLHGDV